MFDFKNHVKKIISKSPSRNLAGLQENLKVTEKGKIYTFLSFIFVNIPMYQSSADFGRSLHHIKTHVCKFFLISLLGRGCCGRPPLQGAPMGRWMQEAKQKRRNVSIRLQVCTSQKTVT
jgi:hypothetical protein